MVFVCRRNGIHGEDAEEFRSETHLKLISDDYAILRKFDGRSALGTYLTVVIQRLVLDFRNERWGKWRPSESARRMGTDAILLETLLIRDGYEFDDAVTMMKTNHGVTRDRDELYQMSLAFPYRWGRSSIQEVAIDPAIRSSDRTPEQCAMDAEIVECGRILDQVIREEIEQAEPEDQTLLRLVHLEGRKVSAIARTLQLDQRTLYRRIYRWQSRLRSALEKKGLDWQRTARLFEEGAPRHVLDLDRIFERRPSNPDDESPTIEVQEKETPG